MYRFESIKAVSANHFNARKALERPQVIRANLRRKRRLGFPRRAFEINGIV